MRSQRYKTVLLRPAQCSDNLLLLLQLEEFEELQSELRARDRQLREQKQVTKDLDIYQGENAVRAAPSFPFRHVEEPHGRDDYETHCTAEKNVLDMKRLAFLGS